MSKRLSYDEDIAVCLGFPAAAAYERLRWFIEESEAKQYIGEVHDGRQWVGFTYEKLRVDYLRGFRSDKALRDTLSQLEQYGLIVSRRNGHGKWFALGSVTPNELMQQFRDPQAVTPLSPEGQSEVPTTSLGVTNQATPTDENGHSEVTKTAVAINIEIDSVDSKDSTIDSVDSSSSPTPPAVEEKEISKGPTTLLIEAFAELCKSRPGNPKVASYLDQIRTTHPEVTPADFRAFKMYYEAVRGKDDKYEHPYPLFVADGWGRFTEWWKAHRDDGVFGHLPGVDDTFNLARWVWVSLEDWPAGEGVLSPRRDGMVFYAKQPDGSFREVPREQWPEWAVEQVAERESA